MSTLEDFEKWVSKVRQIGGSAGRAALAEVASKAIKLYNAPSSDIAKEKFKNKLEEIGVVVNAQQVQSVYANAHTFNNKDNTVYANSSLEQTNVKHKTISRGGAVSYASKEEGSYAQNNKTR